MSGDILIILLVLVCAVVSFVMSGMESGVLALSPLRIRQLKRAGDHRAEVLQRYLERPENFLWTILIGNTISNFIVISFVVVFLLKIAAGPVLLRIGLFAMFAFLFYVVCELLPKMLFRMFPNRLCLAISGPFQMLHFVLAPIVALVAWFSRFLLRWTGGRKFNGNIFGDRDELRFLMQESAQAFTSEEKTMINRVLDLQSLTLRHITIPLNQAMSVSVETSMSEVLRLARESRHTRFPVWKLEGGRQKIVGLVSLKTLLYSPVLDPSRPAGEYVTPALYLNEGLRLEDALQRLRRGGHHLAIVLGRDHREIGIVTLQDILKTIFGEVAL